MIEESDVKERADARNPLFGGGGGEDGQTIELSICCWLSKKAQGAHRAGGLDLLLITLCIMG